MTVKLVIKSATQTVDDFSLDCDLSWTIGFVKEKITELYPTNPKKENQKLIYGGKLLPDHLSLKSVINPVNMTQERHIVHLVCPAPYKSNTNASESKQQAAPSQTFPVPPSNPAFPPVNQAVFNPASFSGMPGMAVTPLNTGDAFQQYLAMQQMYTQFMTQYLSQYNGGVPPVMPHAPGLNVPPVQSPQVPLPQQNAPQNPPRRQAEEEDRDYIDYLYIFSRAIMLFAVLFYYSSLVRVMIVVSMFLFISIYVKFNRQQQQEIQQRNNQRQRNESAQTQQQPPADIQVSGSEENASSASTSDTTSSEAAVSEQSEERSFSSMVSTTASLITAFFSSLIPADPVPVNVN